MRISIEQGVGKKGVEITGVGVVRDNSDERNMKREHGGLMAGMSTDGGKTRFGMVRVFLTLDELQILLNTSEHAVGLLVDSLTPEK